MSFLRKERARLRRRTYEEYAANKYETMDDCKRGNTGGRFRSPELFVLTNTRIKTTTKKRFLVHQGMFSSSERCTCNLNNFSYGTNILV